MIVLLAILIGPFVYGIVYGIRHRDSGAPKDEGTLEAPSMMQSLKDWLDTCVQAIPFPGAKRRSPC